MSSHININFTWHALPNETKLDVLDLLEIKDIHRIAAVDHHTYSLCLPALFRVVKLRSAEALEAFVATVPSAHVALVRELDVCTKPATDVDLDPYAYMTPSPVTDTLVALLDKTRVLNRLALSVRGSLANQIIPAFARLAHLKRFAIKNWADEDIAPLSERLVVAAAFALPALEDLALTRITRSAEHAADLLGAPHVPLCIGDDGVPPHPLLGADLRLPALLRHPRLRRLRIRDTHLGDPLWCPDARAAAAAAAGLPVPARDACPLEVLDVGACAHESPLFNQECTERILRGVPSTVTAFSLSTALASPPPFSTPSDVFSPPAPAAPSPSDSTALPHLRTLHLTPLVPTAALGATLAQPQLAASPVHTLACTFHPDDAAHGCAALAAFLAARPPAARYTALRRVRVALAAPGDADAAWYASMYTPGSAAARRLARDRADAAARLRALCAQLGLESSIEGAEGDELSMEVVVPRVPEASAYAGAVRGTRSRALTN